MRQAQEGSLPTSKGVTYLEVKWHMLMAYCTNICYYMLLKSAHKSVKDHPVIQTLLQVRADACVRGDVCVGMCAWACVRGHVCVGMCA